MAGARGTGWSEGRTHRADLLLWSGLHLMLVSHSRLAPLWQRLCAVSAARSRRTSCAAPWRVIALRATVALRSCSGLLGRLPFGFSSIGVDLNPLPATNRASSAPTAPVRCLRGALLGRLPLGFSSIGVDLNPLLATIRASPEMTAPLRCHLGALIGQLPLGGSNPIFSITNTARGSPKGPPCCVGSGGGI